MAEDSQAGAGLVAQLAEELRAIAARSDAADREVIMNAVHTLEACQPLLARAGWGVRAA